MSEEAPQAWLAVAEAAQQARRGGMNELCERFDAGLQAMIDAFAELTTLAYRAGVGRDAVVPLHGRFFDGKVSASETFGAASILARVWCDQAGDSDGRSPVNESTQERARSAVIPRYARYECPCCLGDPDTVCDACGQHCCWAGVFLCEDAYSAGTRQASEPPVSPFPTERTDPP